MQETLFPWLCPEKVCVGKSNLGFPNSPEKKENYVNWKVLENILPRISLMVQCWGINLSMKGTQVQSLVWEVSICLGATKPEHPNYWALHSKACILPQEMPPQWEACVLQLEGTPPPALSHLLQLERVCSNKDPVWPKIN